VRDWVVSMLLRDVRLVPVGGPAPDGAVDVRLDGDLVAAVAPDLSPLPSEPVVEGGGRWLIPGLWDAHVHLGQWARQGTRLDLAGTTSRAQALSRIAAAPAGANLLVGGGYRPATWAEPPTVAALDEVTGERPVVLVSGDAHAGWLNSAALRRFGLPEQTDPLTEAAWFAVLPAVLAVEDAQVGPGAYGDALRAAARLGIVGVSDFEFEPGFATWPGRYDEAGVPLRVRTSTYPVDLPAAISAGLRTGSLPHPDQPLLTMGSLKIISDGSLNTRTAHCCQPYPGGGHGVQNVAAGDLAELLAQAKKSGLEVALHAIGDAAVGLALDAFAASGAQGSIEHAQLMRAADIDRMAALGLTASVQPAHLLDDRSVTAGIWGEERAGRSFPLRALVDAGVPLALGSDAPVARLDPWLGMAAAVHRGEPGDTPWHPEHSLTAAEALAASTGGLATVRPGQVADLALLDADPLAPGGSDEIALLLRGMHVATTIVAGRVVHDAR
jgi:predicted amidohydrolase YtcJ